MAPGEDSVERIRARVQESTRGQQALERHLAAELGTDHPGLMVMNTLVGDGPSTPTTLARGLAASPAATSLVLQRLESAGHITRAIHPDDRRKVVVTPTEPSRRAALDLIEPFVSGIGRIVADFSASELVAIERFLDQLNQLYRDVASSSLDVDDQGR